MKSKSCKNTLRPRFICCLRHGLENRQIMPKRPPKIEIEKCHTDLLLQLNQAVTKNCPDFLGTALALQAAEKGPIAVLLSSSEGSCSEGFQGDARFFVACWLLRMTVSMSFSATSFLGLRIILSTLDHKLPISRAGKCIRWRRKRLIGGIGGFEPEYETNLAAGWTGSVGPSLRPPFAALGLKIILSTLDHKLPILPPGECVHWRHKRLPLMGTIGGFRYDDERNEGWHTSAALPIAIPLPKTLNSRHTAASSV